MSYTFDKGDQLKGISAEEWKAAENYFQEHPNEVKLSKKKSDSTLNHSFIKVNGTLYAVEPGHSYLGKGGFGKVKKCYAKNGDTFAVKVQLGEIRDLDMEEKGLAAFSRLKGVAQRKRDRPKRLKRGGKALSNQVYLVQDLIKGQNLLDYLSDRDEPLPLVDKVNIALRCAQNLNYFHEAGFGHFDVAKRNFMIDEQGEVYLVDFGNAKYLEPIEGTSIRAATVQLDNLNAIGDLGMVGMMNEVMRDYDDDAIPLYETLDVLCFAKMLDDLGLKLPIDGLEDEDPLKRPTMTQVVDALQKFHDELDLNNSALLNDTNSSDLYANLPKEESFTAHDISELDLNEPEDSISDLQSLIQAYLPEAISQFFFYKKAPNQPKVEPNATLGKRQSLHSNPSNPKSQANKNFEDNENQSIHASQHTHRNKKPKI